MRSLMFESLLFIIEKKLCALRAAHVYLLCFAIIVVATCSASQQCFRKEITQLSKNRKPRVLGMMYDMAVRSRSRNRLTSPRFPSGRAHFREANRTEAETTC